MKKEHNVVMLATTRNNSNIFLKDKKLYFDKYGKISNKFIAQLLYITSNEEIKEGDWVLNIIHKNECIHQVENNKSSVEYHIQRTQYKKIIATTDKSLIIDNKTKKGLYLNSIYLPQIPQSFINTFIEQYNKGDVIDKVLVEYERYFRKANTGIPPKESLVSFPDELRLKINPDNTINISLIEEERERGIIITSIDEKKYSRSEVEKLCRDAFNGGWDRRSIYEPIYSPNYGESENEWIEENLK